MLSAKKSKVGTGESELEWLELNVSFSFIRVSDKVKKKR